MNRTSRILLRACGLFLILVASRTCSAEAAIVVVVNDQDTHPYSLTQDSFEASLRQVSGTRVIHLSDDSSIQELGEKQPTLVFALGTAAVTKARRLFDDPPLLATMLLSTTALDNLSEATAVLLKFSPHEQLKWHRRMLPKSHRVGILFDPRESQSWVDEAKVAALELGLQIVAIPVFAPNELPAALKSLARRADSILGIPDKTVYSNKTAKAILLFSFRNRIPFIGISNAWVKAGALYSLDTDYTDLGRQCAFIAQKVIDGETTSSLALQSPDKILYQLNLKTAKQLKLTFNPEVIAGASEIYQ